MEFSENNFIELNLFWWQQRVIHNKYLEFKNHILYFPLEPIEVNIGV